MRTPNYSTQPFQANSTTASTQAYGQVAAQSTGAYVAVWTDYSTGTARTVGRRFDAQGNPATAEVALVTGGGSTYNAITVTPDNAPHVAVAYNGTIYEHAYDPTTLALSGGFVTVSQGGTNTRPAITSFADGSQFVTYTLEQTGSQYNIFGAPISANGTLGTTVQLTTDSDITDNSRVSTLTNGNFVTVYESQFAGSNTDHDVIFQIRNKTGGVVKSATTIAGGGSGALDTGPDVAALTNGGFATVWSSGTNSTNDIKLDVYDSAGNITHTTQTVNTTTTGYQSSPHVSGLPNGGFVVTWQDSQTSTQRAQVYDANGNAIGGEITTLSSSAFLTDSATLSTGQTVLSFDSTAGGDYNIVNGILDTRENATNHISGANFFASGQGDELVVRNTSTPLNQSASGGTLTLLALSADGSASQIGTVGADWVFDAAGDTNGDGRSDLLAHHDVGTNRDLYIFQMGQNQVAGVTKIGTVTTDYQVAGAGDFNHDGFADELLTRDSGGNKTLYTLPIVNGTPGNYIQTGVVPSSWTVDAIGNLTSDPKQDSILMHYDDSVGHRNLELLNVSNGVTQSVTNLGVIGTNTQVVGLGDFNGDGTQDVLFEYDQNSTRNLIVGIVQNNQIVGTKTIGAVGNNYQFDSIGDFNNDGTADIGYHVDAANGTRTTGAFLMQNYAIASNKLIGTTGNEWEVA